MIRTYLRLVHHQLQLEVYALVVEWGTNGRDWSQVCDQWNGVIEIVTFISWCGVVGDSTVHSRGVFTSHATGNIVGMYSRIAACGLSSLMHTFV